ncbi:hypothetical protein MLD38_014073 [Melastoma candidum]|uniref:Uncharacterized protein n=1 Tax=Melastoma candidum TaxID=119954 RepID=A0ACB9RAZ2_9MYRT|nr:hypothetical protein MLD38_014073 [Melastoma candidum]
MAMASVHMIPAFVVLTLVSCSTGVALAQVCQRMTDVTCGREVVASVFDNRGNVTEKCCGVLLQLGEECHNTLVERRIAAGGYEDKQVVDIIRRSFGVWSTCSSIDSCKRITDPTCGREIVQKVFHGQGDVSGSCCGVLLQKGKRCHTVLVGERILAGGYETNATQVIRASVALWNNCSTVI